MEIKEKTHDRQGNVNFCCHIIYIFNWFCQTEFNPQFIEPGHFTKVSPEKRIIGQGIFVWVHRSRYMFFKRR